MKNPADTEKLVATYIHGLLEGVRQYCHDSTSPGYYVKATNHSLNDPRVVWLEFNDGQIYRIKVDKITPE